MIKKLLFVFSIVLFSNIYSQTTPHQMVANMGKGINLGNTLSAPIEGNWAQPVEQTFFQDIAALGFKTVRVPIRFDNQTTPLSDVIYEDGMGNYIGSASDYSVTSSYLDRVEQVTDWALAEGLIVIIDVHGDHWYWESYDASSSYYKTGNDLLAAQDRFKAIWRDISNRFQSKPEELLFEIMNEPYFSMSNAEVEQTYNFILPIIRNNNPTRNVIVTGGGSNSWQAPLQLTNSFINSDNYLIATFHYYVPFSFTSSSKPQHNDFDWGTTSDKNLVDTHFDNVLNWSNANNIPVFLGEYAADNTDGFNYFTNTPGAYGGPDNNSRLAYHDYITEAAASRGFPPVVWCAGEKSNKSLFLFTNRRWVTDVRTVMLDPTCTSSDLLQNQDIECAFDVDWSIQTSNGTDGIIFPASLAESRNNDQYLKVEVTNSNGTLNSAILRNVPITNTAVQGESYRVSFYGKSNVANSEFRMRLRIQSTSGTSFVFSPVQTFTTDYTLYSADFTIPFGIDSVEFEILLGKQNAIYYLDDFNSENLITLSTNNFQKENFKIYPNPTNGFLTFENYFNEAIVYDLHGRIVSKFYKNNNLLLDNKISNGIYLLRIITKDNYNLTRKFILNR